MRFRALACTLSLAAFSLPSIAKRFQVSDWSKIVRLSDPEISPDGRSIVVVLGRANFEPTTS